MAKIRIKIRSYNKFVKTSGNSEYFGFMFKTLTWKHRLCCDNW